MADDFTKKTLNVTTQHLKYCVTFITLTKINDYLYHLVNVIMAFTVKNK